MKFKKIPTEYLIICLDRLTRFKPTNEKYKRVFYDILNKFVIGDVPKNPDSIIEIVSDVINNSVSKTYENDFYINNLIKDFENKAFFQDCESEAFLNNKINYKNLFEKIGYGNLPDSSKWLTDANPALGYPVEKVLLCEGATEEILLPKLAEFCGYDFLKNGIYLLGAGGKNQVGRKYLKMLDEIKLPIFILLDSDAVEIEQVILKKLRKIDDIYLIKKGEFEDILPKKLIIEAINFNFSNEHRCLECDFDDEIKMSKNLEIIFKAKGFGDFKKADFANSIKNYLDFKSNSKTAVSKNFNFTEIKLIVNKVHSLNLLSSYR